MRVVAIDTAWRGRLAVAAVVDSEEAVGWAGRVREGTAIDTALPALLEEACQEPVDAVAVVTGPGSHTGVRAGIAAAAGLAVARGVGLFGIGSLEVIALASLSGGHRPGSGTVWAVAAAGRGGLLVAHFDHVDGGVEESMGARRVDAASWRPPGAGRGYSLSALEPGVAAIDAVDVASEAAAVGGLALAALAAIRRPALDPRALHIATHV